MIAYRLSYSAESLAHALLPGLVVAALVGAPLLVGGAAGLVVAALAIALAGRTPVIGHDTAVAVVVTALLGLGALLALSPDTPAGLQSLLFGDVLGVSDADLALAAGLALLIVVALRVLHARLLAVGFDRDARGRAGDLAGAGRRRAGPPAGRRPPRRGAGARQPARGRGADRARVRPRGS